MHKYSFPPIATPDARILVLGSMPGQKSLNANQYYAHPQNQFWKIMGELVGANTALSYEERRDRLKGAKIALWDVLEYCFGELSADANIRDEVPNDFNAFFGAHSHISAVFFNGKKAEDSFRHFVMPKLNSQHIKFALLPSTSPAHAGMTFPAKLDAWRAILKV